MDEKAGNPLTGTIDEATALSKSARSGYAEKNRFTLLEDLKYYLHSPLLISHTRNLLSVEYVALSLRLCEDIKEDIDFWVCSLLG
jgi:hypothetical protein